MHAEPLRDRAQGKWRAIIAALGMESKFLTGKNSSCPWCAGRDRWRFINRDGSGNWICNQCGKGDGLMLAMRVTGSDFAETAKKIESLMGSAVIDKEPQQKEVSIESMKRLWSGARTIEPGSPGWLYFDKRGLVAPSCLRFSPKVYYGKDEHSPAILAKVASPAGKCVNLYRIFITRSGDKAPIERPKRMMRARVPPGVAGRVAPLGPILGVAEGIENAVAAQALFGVPTWATFGTEFMERFAIPEVVEELVIFGDNDASFAGQKAAYALAQRAAQGRRVRVEMPPEVGVDWNDMLLRKRA